MLEMRNYKIKVPTAPDALLGREGENNSRTLKIKTLDSIGGFAEIRLIIDTLDCGPMTVTSMSNFKLISMVIGEDMLGAAGVKTCQLVMLNASEDVVLKSNQFYLETTSSNVADRVYICSEDAIEQAIDALVYRGVIDRLSLVNDSVTTEKLADEAVTTEKLKDHSVTADKVDPSISFNTADGRFEELRDWIYGYYQMSGSTSETISSDYVEDAYYACQMVACTPGEVYSYTGNYIGGSRAYAVTDGTFKVLSVSEELTQRLEDGQIIIPANGAYLFVNANADETYKLVRLKKLHFILRGTDLNTLTEEGVYTCASGSNALSLHNLPEDITTGFCLEVERIKAGVGFEGYIRQTLISNVADKKYFFMYIRIITTAVGPWNKIFWGNAAHPLEIENLEAIPAGTDLDDIVTYGSYYCSNAATAKTIRNLPFFVDSSFSLYVVNSHRATTVDRYVRQFIFANKKELSSVYTRVKNLVWGEWQLVTNSSMCEQPHIFADSDYLPERPQGTPVKTIRIGTSNVAHYWAQGRNYSDGLPRYLADMPVKVAMWRRWLMHSKLDILFLQECEDYIDHGTEGNPKSMSAFDNLYAPFFDSDHNTDTDALTNYDMEFDPESAARRKVLNRLGLNTELTSVSVSSDDESYTKHGYVSYCTASITGVGSVLLVNVHNFFGMGVDRVTDRKKGLDTIAGIITQSNADYFIVAGDFNCKTTRDVLSEEDIAELPDGWRDDREIIHDFCEEVGGVPANGGMIGWFATCSQEEAEKPYDNVIVSENIRIDDIMCDPTLVPAGYLHTDHTPVVVDISFMEGGNG